MYYSAVKVKQILILTMVKSSLITDILSLVHTSLGISLQIYSDI